MDLAELDAPLNEFNASVYMDPGRRFLLGVLSMHTVEDTEGRERTFLVLETTEADPAPYVLSAAGFLVCVLALPRAGGGRVGGGRVRKGRSARRGRGGSLGLGEARAALRCLVSSSWLALLMVQGVAVLTLSRICQVNLFQPVLLDHGIAESWHGGVLAAMTVAEAAGSARPQRLSRSLSPMARVSVLGLALAASLAGLTFGGPWTVVVLLCLCAAAAGFAYSGPARTGRRRRARPRPTAHAPVGRVGRVGRGPRGVRSGGRRHGCLPLCRTPGRAALVTARSRPGCCWAACSGS
ncbi:hypothetical protein ACF1DY_10515 [Streptomyces albus]